MMGEYEENQYMLKNGMVLNGHFEIQKTLGAGGFGITYMAIDRMLGRPVAIKEFYPGAWVNRNVEISAQVVPISENHAKLFENMKKKFIEEARIMARLDSSSHVVNVYNYFEENNTAYIVMEMLIGITLRNYVEENGTVNPDYLSRLMIPLVRALHVVHSHMLIHRDIAPDNIMLLTDIDGNYLLKLMDFGAARAFDGDTQKSMSVVLKHGFAPFEQYQRHGAQGAWTDIYALSATMYYCVTGLIPETAADRIAQDELKRPSEIGFAIRPKIEDIIMKGLNIQAKDRYQTARDMADAMEFALKGVNNNLQGSPLNKPVPSTSLNDKPEEYERAESKKPLSLPDNSNENFETDDESCSVNRNKQGVSDGEQGEKPQKIQGKVLNAGEEVVASKRKRKHAIAAAGGVLIALVCCVLFWNSYSKNRADSVLSTEVLSSESTDVPISIPMTAPTNMQTNAPTAAPTSEPTGAPTAAPTSEPTGAPTAVPTSEPTSVPTAVPTSEPTSVPTAVPTSVLTSAPVVTPTSALIYETVEGSQTVAEFPAKLLSATDGSAGNGMQLSINGKINVGDHILFGTYEQDNDSSTADPIEWVVLYEGMSGVLMLSVDVLDYVPYHNTLEEVSWTESDLFSWLNEDFYNAAFTQEEQNLIIVNAGCSVGLLSTLLIDEYPNVKAYMSAQPTAYAQTKQKTLRSGNCWWWLSGRKKSIYAPSVDGNGVCYDGVDLVTKNGNGVRPCIMIQIVY